MNILITRPKTEGLKLQKELESIGYKGILCPQIEIVAEYPQNLDYINKHLDHIDYFLFTSVYAVKFCFNLFNKTSLIKQLNKNSCYAVGNKTAQSLKNNGVEAISPLQNKETSEGLFNLLLIKTNPNHKKILIVKGVGGRDFLQTELEKKGAKVSTLICYRRKAIFYSPFYLRKMMSEQKINVIVLTSCEIIENFTKLLGTTLSKNYLIIVPSMRVKWIAEKLGFNTIIVSEGASNEAIINALKKNIPLGDLKRE